MTQSEAHSEQVFRNSGAAYELQIVAGADHKLDDIDSALEGAKGTSIADEAVMFFGLGR